MPSLRIYPAKLAEMVADGIRLYSNTTEITSISGSYYEFPVGATIKMVATGTFTNASLYNPVTEISYQFTLSVGNTTATLTAPNSTSLSLTYTGVFPKTAYTFSTADVAGWASSNFEMRINAVLVVAGGSIMVGDAIELTAINNYKFIEAKFYDPVFEQFYYLTLSPDGKVATGSLAKPYGSGYFTYQLESAAPIDVKGSNSVYIVADADLDKVTKQRFNNTSPEDQTDFGRFILGLIELPFEVDSGYVVGTEPIYLGPLNIGVDAQLMNVDKLTYSLGSISVPEVFANGLDFANTEAILHLPYANAVTIDLDYVIGETISIDLVISLYDAAADYNLISTKIGGVFTTNKVQLDFQIPFASPEGAPSKNNPASIQFGVDNGVRTAYIEIRRKGAVLSDGMFTTPVAVEGALGGVSGYVVVEDVALAVKATSREIEMIGSELSGGVHIA